MMPWVAVSIFNTAPQHGQVTSKLDSRFATSESYRKLAVRRLFWRWPFELRTEQCLLRREAQRQNLELIEQFPAQQDDGDDHDHDGQHFSETQAALVGVEAACPKAENIERGEGKNQAPENVVDTFARRAEKKHRRQRSGEGVQRGGRLNRQAVGVGQPTQPYRRS